MKTNLPAAQDVEELTLAEARARWNEETPENIDPKQRKKQPMLQSPQEKEKSP